jgi:hypothetical protein
MDFEGRATVIFGVVGHPAFPDCEPATILNTLVLAGVLRRFIRKHGRREGDCHEVALALILDLDDHKERVPFKWQWLIGDCPKVGEHSWIECEGWAIDASNGNKRPIIIQRATDYRRSIAAENIDDAIERRTPGRYRESRARSRSRNTRRNTAL